MSGANPRQVVEHWNRALNLRDAAGVAELYHEDAEKVPMATGRALSGKAAILEFMRGLIRAFPDFGTTIDSMYENGEWIVVEWTRTGTWLDEFAGKKSTGRKFTLRGCGVFRVIDGKIKTHRVYWDKATWFGQIGMPLS